MSNKKSFLLILSGLLILALAETAIASKRNENRTLLNPDLVRIQKSHQADNRSLDDDYTQMRYVKTTDYGVTWSNITQAGNIENITHEIGAYGEFSACITNDNQLCYALPIRTTVGGNAVGIYSLTGPTYSPVLAITEGANDFSYGGINHRGWTDVGRTPNGDLFIICWGKDNNQHNTLWAVKSTNNGTSWGTPWVVATEPSLSADAKYFHISDLNNANYCFYIYQVANTNGGFDQYVGRFPTTGGAGTAVFVANSSEENRNYYTGNCKPISYDATNNALYCCFWSEAGTGTAVFYSGNMGTSFSGAEIPGATRYPSSCLRNSNQTPFIFSNVGPGSIGGDDLHWSWFTYDEFGYNGGGWTDQITCASIISNDGADLIYQNQGYWWDDNRGIISHNHWGAHTPNGLYTSRTTDGGTTWIDFTQRFDYISDLLDASTIQGCEVVGGTNGIGYIVTSGKTGATDEEGPTYDPLLLLSSPTTLGPYVIKCFVNDNVAVDPNDNHVAWYNNLVNAGEENDVISDSAQITDPLTNAGWYFFTIADTNVNGSHYSVGDTINFYCHGGDLAGNQGQTQFEQYIIAGVSWQGVEERTVGQVDAFKLYANYPNPFNPETRILFDIAKDSFVTLKVYNTLGQVVSTLVNKPLASGQYVYNFNGSNLPSGIYMYKLTAGNFTATNKMVLVK